MKPYLLLLLVSCVGIQAQDDSDRALVKKKRIGAAASVSNTPTLFSFLGKDGIDVGRGGSTTAAKAQIWNFDSAGPRQLTAGSLMIISGEWPNHPTTGGGYHAACTAPCSPAFVDNNALALSKVFTEGSGSCYDSTYNHNIYYEPNILSTVTYVQDAFPALISNNAFDAAVFYNVATSTVLDTSSCLTGITPANNTAPNITGTALTMAASGELVWVEIDDYSSLSANTISSITVPSNCSLMENNTTPNGYAIARWTMYCIPTSTSFTPTFTVAQSTHDTFVIYAAAFKAGSGGSAPAAGPGIIAQSQIMMTGSGNAVTVNVGCPASTTSIWVTDDAGDITSITDSNSNTYVGVSATSGGTNLGNGQAEIFNTFSPTTTGMPNTFTMTLANHNSGSVDLISFYCGTGMSSLVTLTAGSGSTQQDTHTVYNTSGTCTSDHCTNIPLVTPANSAVLFFESCEVGTGPLLQAYNLAGNITDFAMPAASASIVGGDADDYGNGDMGGHYYASTSAQINFGWNSISTTAAPTCIVQAGH
jgi:hypothetical protein